MKSVIIFSISFLFSSLVWSQEQKPEVLIMGTMHDVPKIVKHAYKPLLKIAITYEPDAIYTEHNRPHDSLSLANDESQFFLPYSDSISKIFQEEKQRTLTLTKKDITNMTSEDFEYLKHYYAVQKDKANWYYYQYLHKYGIKGSKKPLRHENGDLTSKLAIAMGMNFIYSMDYQKEAPEYSRLWRQCIKQSRKDGEIEYLVKHNKRDYRKHILPGLFGNLGTYSNKQSSIRRYRVSNRFEFRKTPFEPCKKAGEVWDRRNAGMAKNIGEQVLEYNHTRAIVIVGAGHVLGIKEELEKQFPELRVRILDED
ncbi:hypothetical protein POV27_09945 [Aureisphaera galaxeae]|uniref:hypothetical protein n=1 Tax=Aureisphaera galaxeae TaxID=1538023 RepID=UPI00234FB9DA|nr:hypothetical protein [Aureisphaera galaxeae]MDC8004374.1 hypothetical protein [Aureisphaera galaxeae]